WPAPDRHGAARPDESSDQSSRPRSPHRPGHPRPGSARRPSPLPGPCPARGAHSATSLDRDDLNRASVLTPTRRSTSLPAWKTRPVGLAEARRPPGPSWFWSVFIFPILTLPWYSPASLSIVGASERHGAHQGAQKSTRTGMDESRTSDCQLASVN